MNPRLRQICGYELCIITKDIHIDVNIFRTNIVTDLQQKYVGIYTTNSVYSTTSAAYYKDKVFSDGVFLHATIKY